MSRSLVPAVAALFVVIISLTLIAGAVIVDTNEKLPFIEYTGEMLCNFRLKTVHVYFENTTSLGYSGELLHILSKCNISYISFRNKFKESRLAVVNNDYIMLYLVMILHDASQPLELSIIKKKSAGKHLSYILLLIENSSLVSKAWLRNTFKKFWKIWVLNVVIMYWRHEQLQVYRYNPFSDSYLIKVNLREKLPIQSDLFSKSIPDMQGRPLRMCMYADEIRAIFGKDGQITGSDGYMSSFIAERFNATRIVDRRSIAGDLNTTNDVCFHEIHTELDDIAMNTRFLAFPTMNKRVEYTIVHDRDDLCVLVPKAKIASTFWNLFRSFQNTVWLPVLISVPLAFAFCIAIHGRACFTRHFLLELYAGLLSMPLTRIPLRYSLRLFFFFWLIYGSLICNAFKGNLTSNLVFRKYLPDINTIEDLALSSYNLLLFGRHQKHLDNFLDPSNRYEARIKQKLNIVPVDLLFNEINKKNISYAYVEKFHMAKYHTSSRNHTRYGRPLYHIMATCLVPFHSVFILPYGSPYVGFMNYLIRSSHEFGYYTFWDHITNHATFIRSGKNTIRNQQNGDDLVVLKLSHFTAAYCLLVVGLTLSFLVFIWEIKH